MNIYGNDPFGRYGQFRDGPPQPDLKEVTDEELGAKPIANGPTKENHLAYCKKHALSEIPDAGNVMSSLIQDFGDDERTRDYQDTIVHLMMPLTLIGEFEGPSGPTKLRKFILDFQ